MLKLYGQTAWLLYRIKALPVAAKVGIVVGGYALAFLFAFCAVAIYISQTDGPDREAYAAMYAFGDALLFVAVFGVGSIVPTVSVLIFLRQSSIFWIICCVVALAVASTSLGAVAAILLASNNAWAVLAVPRIFVSPFLATLFGLPALIVPAARFRWYLFGAAGIEGITRVYGFFHWFAPIFFH